MRINETSETILGSVSLMAEHGHDNVFIEAWLKQRNIPEREIEALLDHAKSIRTKKSDRVGRQMLLAGIFILGIGFIFSVIFAHSGNSITFPLYGLTAIGTILLLIGIGKLMH